MDGGDAALPRPTTSPSASTDSPRASSPRRSTTWAFAPTSATRRSPPGSMRTRDPRRPRRARPGGRDGRVARAGAPRPRCSSGRTSTPSATPGDSSTSFVIAICAPGMRDYLAAIGVPEDVVATTTSSFVHHAEIHRAQALRRPASTRGGGSSWPCAESSSRSAGSSTTTSSPARARSAPSPGTTTTRPTARARVPARRRPVRPAHPRGAGLHARGARRSRWRAPARSWAGFGPRTGDGSRRA